MEQNISDSEQRERDNLLRGLLKMPPQPRPKRDRGKPRPKPKGHDVPASDEKHKPSASPS